MLNQTQLKSMIELQNTMNKTVNENWINLNWDFMRASCLEGSEAVDHHGWKWWKKQEKDLPQLQMEVIDIWHFYLSRYIQLSKGSENEALNILNSDWEKQNNQLVVFDNKEYDLKSLSILDKLDLLIGLSAAKRTNLHVFFSLAEDCEISFDNLFEQYIKKNILNIFRQKNGYKEGTYHKSWFGKEDNVYLLSEAEKLNPHDENYVSNLWNSLENIYKQALNSK